MNRYDWTRFPYTVSFATPCQVAGTILALEDIQTADGTGTRITILQADGNTAIVNAIQTRLRAELIPLDPQEGDRIRITYIGEAKKAAPGMSPTKDFRVEIRKVSQPPGGTGSGQSGDSAGPENVPEAGR